jgi:hypothetical protein
MEEFRDSAGRLRPQHGQNGPAMLAAPQLDRDRNELGSSARSHPGRENRESNGARDSDRATLAPMPVFLRRHYPAQGSHSTIG